MEEFLKIKKRKELDELNIKAQEMSKSINDADPVVELMKQTEIQVRQLLNVQEDENIHFPIYDYLTKESKLKLEKENKVFEKEKENIEAKYKEIDALCNEANWEEKMKIYKMYGLIED